MENFLKIYEKLSGRVYNFALSSLGNSSDAKDVLQQTFLKFWENREKINLDANYTAYIFSIARNLIYDELRGRLVAYSLDDTKLELAGAGVHPDNELHFKQQQQRVLQIIEQLPDQRRKIFILRKIDNLSYKEIADKLGISENTIDTQLKRSMAFLKANLKDLKLFLIFV